jgi:hypothetical protein
VLDAGDVLRTGMVSGHALAQAMEASRALELAAFDGWQKPLRAWRYVFRSMAAEDMLFFKPAEEMRATLAARRLAKEESGLKRSPRWSSASTRSSATWKPRRTAAQVQARREGLRGLGRPPPGRGNPGAVAPGRRCARVRATMRCA